MRQKPGTRKCYGEKVIKDICRAIRKQYSAEEKIQIVLDRFFPKEVPESTAGFPVMG